MMQHRQPSAADVAIEHSGDRGRSGVEQSRAGCSKARPERVGLGRAELEKAEPERVGRSKNVEVRVDMSKELREYIESRIQILEKRKAEFQKDTLSWYEANGGLEELYFILKNLFEKTKPEYLEYRCCMCPNGNKNITTCPGIAGTPHPDSSPCRFVKTYIDERGWRYKVMQGLGDSNFKARYNKPGKPSWKCVANLPWRGSFDRAQADLNAMAKKKGWAEEPD